MQAPRTRTADLTLAPVGRIVRGPEEGSPGPTSTTTGGLGAGAGIGAAIGHSKEQPNDFFPGLSTEAFAAIGGAVGLIAGGAIGGPTDFTRGPTLYRRP